MRGGERVLEQLGGLFPGAPILTLVAKPERLSAALRQHAIQTSWLARLPGARRHYAKLLPFLPAAARSLAPPASCRFFFSSDAAVLKNVSLPGDVPHVCYCHSPPRYLWDQEEIYADSLPAGPVRWFFRATVGRVRAADAKAAARVTAFIANSRFVQERIARCYGRESVVIHPPVAVTEFRSDLPTDDYYLFVSELTPYKRADLALDAFSLLGPQHRLIVVGGGSELAKLRARSPSNVQLLGRQPFEVLRDHMQRCRALIFPGVEDFGIVMAEAQAAGRPIIARRAGGALDIVREGETGIFFDHPNPSALATAVRAFEREASTAGIFSPAVCRNNAERFAAPRFRTEVRAFLTERFPKLFTGFAWGEETVENTDAV